jgi:RNA polymerase subunit RPABC4/transcription elongation factor Spt4
MPTFKHPCPYCGKFIDRVVSACPFCGVVEPFSPKRCQNCRKIVDDPAWVVCPSCGQSLVAPPPAVPGTTPATGAAAASAAPVQPGSSAGQPVAPAPPPPPTSPLLPLPPAPVQAPAAGPACAGCGAPMPAGARFCTVCGTMAG